MGCNAPEDGLVFVSRRPTIGSTIQPVRSPRTADDRRKVLEGNRPA